jgi:hypothetical protein
MQPPCLSHAMTWTAIYGNSHIRSLLSGELACLNNVTGFIIIAVTISGHIVSMLLQFPF